VEGEVGARAPGRRPRSTSTHFIRSFKKVFFRRNLNQNMPKRHCFLRKSCKIAAACSRTPVGLRQLEVPPARSPLCYSW